MDARARLFSLLCLLAATAVIALGLGAVPAPATTAAGRIGDTDSFRMQTIPEGIIKFYAAAGEAASLFNHAFEQMIENLEQ